MNVTEEVQIRPPSLAETPADMPPQAGTESQPAPAAARAPAATPAPADPADGAAPEAGPRDG